MKALVTGGSGFLGGAIVRRLVERGDTVKSFARGEYPALAEMGVEAIQGDLADAEAVSEAVGDCDVVFHTAAKAGVWGAYESYHRPNVLGTENILSACQGHGTPRLVYTSTPSVTFAGRDEDGVDESEPYAERYLCHYPETKARAEHMVLDANSSTLSTVALRPHLIWGPGDPHLVPRIVERAKAGRLRLVGSGGNKVDSTYIENAAVAHVLAADRLAPEGACAGKAYYISNGEPIAMAELVNGILASAGLPPVTRRVSAGVAYALGAVLEGGFKLLGREDEPLMTRFVARQLSTAHWFDISAARRDLDYAPAVSVEEGLRRLKESLNA